MVVFAHCSVRDVVIATAHCSVSVPMLFVLTTQSGCRGSSCSLFNDGYVVVPAHCLVTVS